MFAFAQTSRNEDVGMASPRATGSVNTAQENLAMQLNPRFLDNFDLGSLDEAKIGGAEAF